MDIPKLLTAVEIKSKAIASAKILYQSRLSPDFNPFVFVGLDENKISSVIAFLLNPSESHGQGRRFFNAFVNEFISGIRPDWDLYADDSIWVQTEARTALIESSLRRIDILVTGANFAFAIENKIWAIDQGDQLSHYVDHLSRRSDQYLLFYLTPEGRDAAEESIDARRRDLLKAEKHLVNLSYQQDILRWIAACQQVTESNRVWAFLEDFSRFIKAKLKGVDDVNRDEIVKIVSETPESIASAFKVIKVAADIKANLLQKLRTQLMDRVGADNLDWYFEDGKEAEKWSGFALRQPSTEIRFRAEFQSANFKDLIYGIEMTSLTRQSDQVLIDRLNSTIGKGRRSEIWNWYRLASEAEPTFPVPSDWDADEEPWTWLVTGKFARIADEAAKKLFKCVAENGGSPW